ncbi:hypothetical protein BHE74_00018229 [Ensete ventricosum]|nr:hypothetical protein GW17_00005373 [Ensete ventricosum]RWW73851.1 hypothetical protein BHE74_00018229 [Ensete ventricosum]RZR98276.1 hypothetical protein BHM03_00027589 [Ensete ventricosum]
MLNLHPSIGRMGFPNQHTSGTSSFMSLVITTSSYADQGLTYRSVLAYRVHLGTGTVLVLSGSIHELKVFTFLVLTVWNWVAPASQQSHRNVKLTH